jgi:NAD(P)-dependent dehydrogenase (short-subunit alcohol dehydrogenase family)
MSGKARGRQSIFITGGASGMGRATAKLFAEKGWFVGIYDVNAAGLSTLEQEIGSDKCVTGILDVTQKPDFDAAIAAFAQQTDGKLDLLFSNAGIGESGWFEDIPFEAALRVVQVNLIGVIASVYAAQEYAQFSLLHHVIVIGDLWHAANCCLFGNETCREGTDRGAVRRVRAS